MSTNEEQQATSDEQTTKSVHLSVSKTKSQEILETATANTGDSASAEFAFARFIVRCPCLLCCIILAIMLILTIIFGSVFELTLQNSRTAFPDPPDKHVDDFDGYSLAAEFVQYEEEEQVNSITQSEEIGLWTYFYIFELENYKNDLDINHPEKTDYWVLTPKNIETIIKHEDKIYKDTEWKNKFCWVGEDPAETNYECQFNTASGEDAVISPARIIAEFYDYEYTSFTTEDARNYTMTFLKHYAFCFNPGFIETGQTWIYRSFFRAGAPIGNGQVTVENASRVHETEYKNAEDQLLDMSGQTGEYYKWGFPLYSDIIINNEAALVDGGLRVQVYSPIVHGNYLFSALSNSAVFLVLAVVVVWCYMMYHLQSLFLASGAMFGILMSFPCAYFIYRVVFQVPIFDVLSTLVVFVLLGVGADDVFVFTDAWTQSIFFVGDSETNEEQTNNCCGCSNGEERHNIKRMSFTYRRAASAMFVTQITTFFAFLATGTSILVNMSAFGIWAACVVMMDYVLVITLYPAVLMLHHKYIKKYEQKFLCCCCRICCKKNNKNKAAPNGKRSSQLSRQSSVKEVAASYGKFEKFLGTKWAVWIIKFKYYVLGFFLIFFILTVIGTASLKTASQTDEAFQKDHWFVVSQKSLRKFTAAETDSLVPCRITFGIKGVNRDNVRKYRPDDYYGKIIWDNAFEMSTIQQQAHLKYICESLKNQTDLVHSRDLVYCPISDFEDYLHAQTNYSFPYAYNGNDMTQSEAFAKEWNTFLQSSYGETSMMDALSYNEHNTDTDTYHIKYYAIWYYSSLVSDGFTIDGAVFEAYLDKMNAFLDDTTGPQSDCPDNLCDSIGNPNLVWVFLSIIEGYISSAVKGILIALPLAFVIMIFSTGNWVIALFALLDIVGVMLSELSIMYALGYEFSLTESIAIIVIIGFSVDYVVHLANAYLESLAETREERISFSLLTIGISVVSGAITTFLAGLFLVFAEFIFFIKMGVILMTTVFMSIFWAMCFFTALCAAFGPEGQTGDLRKYFRMCWNKCRGGEGDGSVGTPKEAKDQMEMSIR